MKKRFWAPIIALLVMAFLVCSCSFSFTKPQKDILFDLGIHEAGFKLAKGKPELAKVVLEYSKKVLKMGVENFTEPDFRKWVEAVMKELKMDPRSERIFKAMIEMVNVEINKLSEGSKEIVKLVYNAIGSFTAGIEEGI